MNHFLYASACNSNLEKFSSEINTCISCHIYIRKKISIYVCSNGIFHFTHENATKKKLGSFLNKKFFRNSLPQSFFNSIKVRQNSILARLNWRKKFRRIWPSLDIFVYIVDFCSNMFSSLCRKNHFRKKNLGFPWEVQNIIFLSLYLLQPPHGKPNQNMTFPV